MTITAYFKDSKSLVVCAQALGVQADVDYSVIALWLGHESVETTQVYLHAHIALKEAALSKITPLESGKITRY